MRVRSVTLGPAKRALYSSGCLVGGCGSGLSGLSGLSVLSGPDGEHRAERKRKMCVSSAFRLQTPFITTDYSNLYFFFL